MATFTNQASAIYNGGFALSNIVTGEITRVISASKDAMNDIYRVGDVLTYIISIQNTGTSDIDNLVITDDLGAYDFGSVTLAPLSYTGDPILYYSNGILLQPTVSPGSPLVISDISVPAGASSTIIYSVSVNEYAPLGINGQIENTATITGAELANPVTVSETVFADPSAVLSIFKSLCPISVVENGQITYTITLQNTGFTAIDINDNLVVRDTFLPILDSPLFVTLNGEPWGQAGNYSYDVATGEFATLPGRVTVPAATYVQDPETGLWIVTPGVTTLTITSTI